MKLVLHSYWRSSASHRVRIGLGLKQLPYDYVAVNLLQGENLADAYRAKNPMAQVPTLEITEDVMLNDADPPSACDSVSSASMSKPSSWPVAALRMLNTGVSMVVPTRSTLLDRMRSIRSCAAAGRADLG